MPKLKTVIIAFGLVCAAGATLAAPLPRQKGCHAQTCRNRVMDSDDFAILYTAVKNQSFKDRQIEIIKIGALGTSFSPSQCLSLMNLFSFDDDKMQVLELMAPRLSEYYGEDTEIILDAFSFPSSKEKAAKSSSATGHTQCNPMKCRPTIDLPNRRAAFHSLWILLFISRTLIRRLLIPAGKTETDGQRIMACNRLTV